jgi:hypothetical protein
MITEIDEPIKVGAVFGADCTSPTKSFWRVGGKKIKPVWFAWKGKQYRIKEVTYTWTNKEGRALVHYFSVTDGQNLYEISYNTETMVWKLIAVEVEG